MYSSYSFITPALNGGDSKVKLSRYRHTGDKGERKYGSFLTSVLDGGEWSGSHSRRALPPGMDLRYPLHRRLGGPQSWSGHRC
jgi:hypothetical protein